MTWYVVQNAAGNLQLIERGTAVPDGWEVVAETANPNYLDDLASGSEE